MILIADSGSTKTGWRLKNHSGKVYSFSTEGLNPYYKTEEEIIHVVQLLLLPQLPSTGNEIEQVFFYGAGCSVPAKCDEVKKALSVCFPAAEIHVEHDILGAARACCGHKKGIVGILGTGSNSCYYDGDNTTEIIGGLGYILGDEGSACHIGKTIIAAYLNHELPKELKNDFYNSYHLNKATIDKKVYQEPNANRFLASFGMFSDKHKTHPFIQNILKNCFDIYLDKHVCRYANFTGITVHFVGSVAYYHKNILIELCKHKGIKTGNILLEPVEELLEFHK